MTISPLSIPSTRNDVVNAAQERSAEARAKADAARSAKGDLFGEHLRKKATTPDEPKRLTDERHGTAAEPRRHDAGKTDVAQRAQDAARGEPSKANAEAKADANGKTDNARKAGADSSGAEAASERAQGDSKPEQPGQRGQSAQSESSEGPIDPKVAEAAAQPLSVRNLNQLLATIDPKLVAKGVVKGPVDRGVAGEAADGAVDGESVEQRGANGLPQAAARAAGAVKPSPDDAADSDAAKAKVEADGRAAAAESSDSASAEAFDSTKAHAPVSVSDVQNAGLTAVKPASDDSSIAPTGVSQAAPSPVANAAVSGAPSGVVKPGVLAEPQAAPLFRAQHADLTGEQSASVAGQVSRGLAAALKQQGGQVTLRLRPEALGHVRIELNMLPGQVDVRFVAGSAQAQALLNGSLHTLKESLERQGLTVGKVQVDGDDTDVLSSITQARKDAEAGGERPGQSGTPEQHGASQGRTQDIDRPTSPEREVGGQSGAGSGGGSSGERNPHSSSSTHDGAERRGGPSSALRSDADLDELTLGAASVTRNGVLDILTLRLDATA